MWNLPRAIASEFAMVDVGSGGSGDDTFMPAKLAWRVFPTIELRTKLTAAVLHVAQAHVTKDKQAAEAMAQITAEILDDICRPWPWPWPWPPPPPPWTWALQQLGQLADSYPAGSMLRNAAFTLGQRVLARAQELGNTPR